MTVRQPAVWIETLERREMWCVSHGLDPSSAPVDTTTQKLTARAVSSGTWAAGKSLPINAGETAAGIIGNTLYVVSQVTKATLTYNFTTGNWSSTTAKARLIHGDHHAAEVVNGKLYLIGGLTEYQGTTEPAGRVQIYNPSNNSWTFGSSLPWKGGSVSTAVINGQIYAAGGIINSKPGQHAGTGSTNMMARYDPVANKWTLLPPMPKAANHTAAATDGKRFFIFGGRGGANFLGNGFATVQMFDPSRQRWASSDWPSSVLKALPVARGGMGKAVFYNNEFYVFGGETQNGAGATSQKVYNRVDIYSPLNNTWRQGKAIPTAVHGMYPVLRGAKIYLAGGGTFAGFSQSKLFQIYSM